MHDSLPSNKCGEVRVGKLAVNLLAVPLCIPIFGVFCLLYFILPYSSEFADSDLIIYLIMVLPLMVAHEGTHALCALHVGGLKRKDLKFGVHWKAMMPYYHLRGTITVKAYRMVTLAPLCLTGTMSVIVFFLHPSIWSVLLVGTALASCIGDVWVFLKLRPFGGELLVKDHPSEIGCDILKRPVN